MGRAQEPSPAARRLVRRRRPACIRLGRALVAEGRRSGPGGCGRARLRAARPGQDRPGVKKPTRGGLMFQ